MATIAIRPARKVAVRRKRAQFHRGERVVVRGADGHRTPGEVTATGNGLVWVMLPDAVRSIPIPAGEVELVR